MLVRMFEDSGRYFVIAAKHEHNYKHVCARSFAHIRTLAGRQTDGQTDRQTDRQIGSNTDRQIHSQKGRQTDRQAGRQTDSQEDRL